MTSKFALSAIAAVVMTLIAAALAWYTNPPELLRYMNAVGTWCIVAAGLLAFRMLFSRARLARLSVWLLGYACVMTLVALVLTAIAVNPYLDSLYDYGRTMDTLLGVLMTFLAGVPLVLGFFFAFSMLCGMMAGFLKSVVESDSEILLSM